jgi:hypothetical protein
MRLVGGIASVFVLRIAQQILTDAFGNENGHIVHHSYIFDTVSVVSVSEAITLTTSSTLGWATVLSWH